MPDNGYLTARIGIPGATTGLRVQPWQPASAGAVAAPGAASEDQRASTSAEEDPCADHADHQARRSHDVEDSIRTA
jgi:hypothetical protein